MGEEKNRMRSLRARAHYEVLKKQVCSNLGEHWALLSGVMGAPGKSASWEGLLLRQFRDLEIQQGDWRTPLPLLVNLWVPGSVLDPLRSLTLPGSDAHAYRVSFAVPRAGGAQG